MSSYHDIRVGRGGIESRVDVINAPPAVEVARRASLDAPPHAVPRRNEAMQIFYIEYTHRGEQSRIEIGGVGCLACIVALVRLMTMT